MSEVEEALLARIRTNPYDWDGWRVFADWLTERGDVRGELVQLGHRLETGALSEGERARLEARRQAIEEEHRPGWLEGIDVPEDTELEWRFGFVTGVRSRRASTVPFL